MGLDPGLRTGVKVAVVDATGKVVATDTIYPHEPRRQWDASIATLARLARAHGVELIAIGNGTASRETDRLAADLIKLHPELRLTKVVVSEAGASVYSASAYASQELPELDVSLRGAVSIARRLQDPLAELVKIDPRSIGVGQYQHDLSEMKLSRSLDAVVEDCVNAVGVDVNTASAPLLTRVSGIGAGLAENIVLHRDANGPFRTRTRAEEGRPARPEGVRAVRGLPAHPRRRRPAGLLQRAPGGVPGGAPHPGERRQRPAGPDRPQHHPARAAGRPTSSTTRFGLPTVTDILRELEKPGRDPRPEFKTATFAEGVEKIGDLVPGMLLEGVVTNVAAFGAFVDVGVHQDGLVHVSAMSHTFVKDPRDVVKSGDVVRVKVLDVDVPRKRISLTLRLDDETTPAAGGDSPARGGERGRRGGPSGGQGDNRRAGKSGTQSGQGGGQGGRRQGEPGRGGQPRQDRRQPEPQGAIADALRRAGLA